MGRVSISPLGHLVASVITPLLAAQVAPAIRLPPWHPDRTGLCGPLWGS